MKLKKLFAALLGVSCMITSLALPAAAQTDDAVPGLSAEALEVQYTVPTLPDSIHISELAGTISYLDEDISSAYLYRIGKRVINVSNGTGTLIDLTTEQLEDLEAATEEIIAKVDPSWDDLTKVMFIHDHITATRCYDTTYTNYSAYDLLVTGTAVCQGYAEAFWYLMYKLNIDCKIVSSNKLNHSWNIVNINGKWYQIDVTWDDPIVDVPGRSVHTYFLLSDDQFRSVNSGKHNATDFYFFYEGGANSSAFGYCTDTTFNEGWLWEGSRVPVVIAADGYFYNIKDAYITRSDSSNNQTQIRKLSEMWFVVGSETSYYGLCFSGLGLNGSTFYFNDDRSVYSCDINGEDLQTIYTMTDEEQASYRLYSLSYADGVITLGYAEDPNVAIQATKMIPVEEQSNIAFVKCLGNESDIDGQINMKFYMFLPSDIAADSSAVMKFSVAGKDYSYPVSSAVTDEMNGRRAYVFSVPIAAAEMNDTITGYIECGEEASAEVTCSVRSYADAVFADPNTIEKYIPAIKAMLNYGAAAQTYFKHSTNALANDGISYTPVAVPDDKLAGYNYTVTDNDDTLDFLGQVISLQNKVAVKLYFNGRTLTGEDISNISGIEAEKVSVKDGYVQISDISAGRLDQPFSVTVGDITISNYSVYSYIADALTRSDASLIAVCSALYDYNEAVKALAA